MEGFGSGAESGSVQIVTKRTKNFRIRNSALCYGTGTVHHEYDLKNVTFGFAFKSLDPHGLIFQSYIPRASLMSLLAVMSWLP